MAKGKSTKKNSISKRELVLFIIIAVLIVALAVTLFGGNQFHDLFGKADDSDSNILYTSVLSGKATISLPTEFEGNNILEVHFIDIGQGDAIAIMLPDGKIILIDAGSGTSVSAETKAKYNEYLSENLNVDKIEYVVVTHPDSDHVNMMSAVLDAYDIDNIYYNAYESGSQTYKTFCQKVESEDDVVDIEINTAEDSNYNINGEGYNIKIYSSGNDGFEGAESEKNSMSIICLLEYGGRKVLFTGDAETETEAWFKNYTNDASMDIDVLKVGHHGSNSCTSTTFLDYIKAEYAVISCDNGTSYGHPAPTTMNTLYNYGMVTYRTNRHGNIVLYMANDGNFGFLPEKNALVENNSKNINPRTISTVKAA